MYNQQNGFNGYKPPAGSFLDPMLGLGSSVKEEMLDPTDPFGLPDMDLFSSILSPSTSPQQHMVHDDSSGSPFGSVTPALYSMSLPSRPEPPLPDTRYGTSFDHKIPSSFGSYGTSMRSAAVLGALVSLPMQR